jgi:extracellular factor (EF) 3-hydroxypalmitic acid methyl ester biosynthesis protein
MLTPLLLDSPMVRRSYTKPLGYPGDYQVMLYYYENAFEGPSVFAKVFHKFFIEHPLSHGVRTRKDMVVDLMHSELERQQGLGLPEPTLRVASLGCGPAREVADFVSKRRRWPGEIRWTLIDQEDETLSVAYHTGHRELMATNGNARGALHCLNLSFAQLLQEPALMRSIEPQDFIYSTGLFDYLRESRAQALIAGLYERLAPGGLLAIGNAVGPNQWFWSPECILDWTLLYRTEAEMRRLAAQLPAGVEVEVVKEPGEAYYFLLARKPREK